MKKHMQIFGVLLLLLLSSFDGLAQSAHGLVGNGGQQSGQQQGQGGQGGSGQSASQSGIFKYRVYLGRGSKCIYRFTNQPDGSRKFFEDASGKIMRHQRINVTTSQDTLYLNLWLLKGNTPKTCEEFEKNENDPNKNYTYFIHLPNRQFVSLYYTDFEISATTAPLKLRFKNSFKGTINSKDTTININTELTTQANVNVNFQARFGRVTYSYDKYAGMTTKNAFSGVAGGFIGLGALQLASTNTKSRAFASAKDTVNFNSTLGQSVPSVSFGASAGINFFGVEIGVLLGWEFPLQFSNLWDYRGGTPFIGFGIGYGIGFVK